jgi:phosphohistidine swiveling domain-containing protein
MPGGAWDLLADRQRRESDELRSVLEKYPHLHYEITWLRVWLYHRNHTTEDYYRSFQQLRPLLAEVARRLDLTYRALLNLSTDEMIQALEGSITDHRRRATERRTAGFWLERRGDDAFLGTGIDEDARLERELLKADELEGQIASRGHAVGTVRIVRDPVLEAYRFNDGDVLVTAMTAPSFVPLMGRAAAIVTDEGGVLCHAALVSREMGKPCVIAVRNATQILANDMRVEVDAEVGRIRILSGC